MGGERSGVKPGRGSENKVPFVCAEQTTEDNQVVLACLSLRRFTNEATTKLAAQSLGAARERDLRRTAMLRSLGCQR